MTVVGLATALSSVFLPLVQFELGVRAAVALGSVLMAIVYGGAVLFDSLRREAPRRRLDGGTLLGATIFIETITGGGSAALQFVLSTREVSGALFVFVLCCYMGMATGLVAVWERVAVATAARETEQQPLVFVIELAVSVFTVLPFVLSQRLDNWEFWLSVGVKMAGIILIDTRLASDVIVWLRSGRTLVRYPTSRQGVVLAMRAERGLLAEQLGVTVCAAALMAEEVALQTGIVSRPVLTIAAPGEDRDSWAAALASLAAFLLLATVAVPISEAIVARKLARSRVRKALLGVYGLVVMHKEALRRVRRVPALAARAKALDELSPATAAAARAGEGAEPEASVALQPRREHFAMRLRADLSLMAAFAVVSAVSGAYFTAAKQRFGVS
ncbi:hypothetical protein FNF31_00820 [Cafeteria roenbergensis]|nr:hypothetical protein FNF31_00820 [Cafeteria roenbergensis]